MTTKTTRLISGTILCLIVGLGYYAWQQEWFIFNYPCTVTYGNKNTQLSNKQAHIWYKDQGQWKRETTNVLWSNIRASENAYRLAQRTLGTMHENRLLKKKVSVIRALGDYTGTELLVFFDHTPFHESSSVQEKIAIIDSILKTLRENDSPFSTVRFFVGTKSLEDEHLDFAHAWPMSGFGPG